MTSTAHKFNNINKQIPETQAPQSLKQNQKLKKIKKSIDFWNTHFPKCKNDELKSQKHTHTHTQNETKYTSKHIVIGAERERERETHRKPLESLRLGRPEKKYRDGVGI